MASDGIFFAGIILFFFLLWFAAGGPNRPISYAGPYITPVTTHGDTQDGYDDDNAWWGVGRALPGSQYGEPYQDFQPQQGPLQTFVNDVTSLGDPSTHQGTVEITGVSSGENADSEYVTIQLSSSAPAPVTITGWRLKSEATRSIATIPNGTELARSGVNSVAPITLKPGDSATISTGDSPIGASFRENKCAGFFAERQTFNPGLWTSCPAPLTEFETYYEGNVLADDECYTYVSGLSQCTSVPTPPATLSRACREFLDEHLDYSGCVATHRSDADFAGANWRVYLEKSGKLWKQSRDGVRLIDATGKTVDLYTY